MKLRNPVLREGKSENTSIRGRNGGKDGGKPDMSHPLRG